MKKNYLILAFLVIFSLFVFAVAAADENQTEQVGLTDNSSAQTPVETPPSNEGLGVAVISFVPTEFKIGDIQFSIQIQNNDAKELKNIMAFVTGKGFSTYNMVPIDSLKPGEKSYVIIMGTAKEEGTVTLTIKINNQVFYQNITVLDPLSSVNQAKLSQIQATEKENAAAISQLSPQLEDLKNKLKALETDYKVKETNNYDLSEVNLNDLRNYIKNAQSSIIQKDVEQAIVSLTLGLEEYTTQKASLDSAGKMKGLWAKWLKDNLGLLAGIAASIGALVTFYELIKKKTAPLTTKVKERVTKTVTTVKEKAIAAKTTKKKSSKKKKK